jgi:hypothetical protein
MRAIMVAALAVAAAMVVPPVALADGDPASDVLLGESVFYPFTPTVSTSLQKELNDETAAASRAHFPIKVALIGSPVDLGAIPTLFGKPAQYADFLDQEISFTGQKQPLLVVMRAGYGVSGLDPAATEAAATGLRRPSGGTVDDLAEAAILAVPKLAAASRHPIGGVTGGSSPGGSSHLLPVLALAVVAVAAAAAIGAVRWRRGRVRGGRSGYAGR